MNRTVMRELRTAAGLYLPPRPTILIDVARLEDYLTRIAKGLHVRNTLTIPNWNDYEIDVHFEQVAQSRKISNLPGIEDMQERARFGQLWENAFSYLGDVARFESGLGSIWTMSFYASFSVIAIVAPKEDDETLDL